MAASVDANALSDQGVPTFVRSLAAAPLAFRSIQGAVSVPTTFDRVEEIIFGDDEIMLRAEGGKSVNIPLNYKFVLGEGEQP